MKRFETITRWVALLATTVLVGCTTGATNVGPNITFTPTNGVLELSIGTVNFAGAAVGLNVFETFRAPSGYTAIPVNTATLTGPALFAAPSGSADPGSGSGSVPMGAAADSFAVGTTGTNLASADGFGVGPPGSSGSPNAFPVQPQFFDVVAPTTAFSAQRAIYGGPPAFPSPSGTTGFPEGFYLLALSATPPTGTYTLTVSYSQNGNTTTKTSTATLGSSALLPTMASPTYAGDGAGGGSGSVSLPAGVTEVLLNITDRDSGARATAVVTGTGSQPYTIPDSLGFTTGDRLRIQAFGFDYDDFALAPPGNLSQSPALPAQADVTVAPQVNTTQ